jgi:hypothetical protein
VTGNATTENGSVSVVGSGAVSVINPGNGKKGENGNGNSNGYAANAQVKEKTKEKVTNQVEFGEEQQNSNGKAKGQAS